MSDTVRIQLGKHVLDKEILDCKGFRCGKVDDLALTRRDDGMLELTAIVTGPLAFAQTLGRLPAWFATHLHRLLGVSDPRPVEVGWHHVDAIDVVVHIDIDSTDTGLQALSRSVGRMFRWIPGS